MGASFSINTLKVKLRSAVERMKMQIGKHTNLIKVQRKEISTLLQTGKDETARIKVESMLALKNMVIALETLQLMCELLLTRVMLIAAEKQCPPDLVEGIASIVYCARRTEVPELAEIAEQFAMKYTVEWVKPHANNTTKKSVAPHHPMPVALATRHRPHRRRTQRHRRAIRSRMGTRPVARRKRRSGCQRHHRR